MKTPHSFLLPVTFSIVSLFAFAVPQRAFCKDGKGGNAQALLEEAKKAELDRKVAAKQKTLDRLNEDLKKGKQEGDDLDNSIAKVTGATNEATSQLDKLGAEKKVQTGELELKNLQIEAEKLKAEGLRLLGIAHAKSREASAKLTAETELKTSLVSEEMQQLSEKFSSEKAATGAKGSNAKRTPTLTELRRQIYKAEQATANANSNARQAMETASQKLQQADAATAKVEKKWAESGHDPR